MAIRIRPRPLARAVVALAGAFALVLGALPAQAATAPSGSGAQTAGDATIDEPTPGGAPAAIDVTTPYAAAVTALSGFQAGDIISDAVWGAKGSMTEAQIAAFIDGRVATCTSGHTCLESFKQSTPSRAADTWCGAYAGATSESAARIISKVSQACRINPQVLLVILQKEQGLVTATAPTADDYTRAMGFGCPDGSACAEKYAGFFNQVYYAARQMMVYSVDPYYSWYVPGTTSRIAYSPTASCGGADVLIENQATANLYYYTPYQPNAAAIAAGWGAGDACSSYGNRNFYGFFREWFGTTGGGSASAVLTGSKPTVKGAVKVGVRVTAVPGPWTWGTSLAYQWLRDGSAISGATASTYAITAADLGHQLAVRVTGTRSGYPTLVKTSSATTVAKGTLSGPVPTISGTVKSGATVTAVPGTWTSGTALAFQWYADGVAISGARSSTYTIPGGLYGRDLVVKVTGTKTGYATLVKASAAKRIAAGTLVSATPRISDTTPKVGQKLTAVPGTWTSGTILTYQWFANGTAISGATASTYLVPSAAKGKKLTVRVIGRKAGYTSVAKTSAATSAVAG